MRLTGESRVVHFFHYTPYVASISSTVCQNDGRLFIRTPMGINGHLKMTQELMYLWLNPTFIIRMTRYKCVKYWIVNNTMYFILFHIHYYFQSFSTCYNYNNIVPKLLSSLKSFIRYCVSRDRKKYYRHNESVKNSFW